MIKKAINKVINTQNLSSEEAKDVMESIMNGQATDAQIGSFLTALRMKGETVEEISAFAKVMDEKASHVHLNAPAIDIVGTGGDGLYTFNISTCAAFIVAAAGLSVAKHGNRSVSSMCGSADVLEALGANITLTPQENEKCFEECGICFMFAQKYHNSMKYAAGPRKEMGTRSIFNILGPLTNPARAEYRLIGVYDESMLEPVARTLLNVGVKRAIVVCSEQGMDEVGISGQTTVCEAANGRLTGYILHPRQLGIEQAPISEIKGGDAKENAKIIRDIYNGAKGPKRDIAVINAAVALYAGERVSNLKEGVKLANEVIDDGSALRKLEEFIAVTNSFVRE